MGWGEEGGGILLILIVFLFSQIVSVPLCTCGRNACRMSDY